MENRFNAARTAASEVSEEAVNALAREILVNPKLAKELTEKNAPAKPAEAPAPLTDPSVNDKLFPPLERTFQIGNTELVYNKKPWLGQAHTLPMSVLFSATAQAGIHSWAGRYGGGVLATSWGLSSAYTDGNNFLASASTLEGTKYGLGLTTDAFAITGGIAQLGKLGPKWLAPTLILGGILGRAAVDLIPNEIRSKK